MFVLHDDSKRKPAVTVLSRLFAIMFMEQLPLQPHSSEQLLRPASSLCVVQSRSRLPVWTLYQPYLPVWSPSAVSAVLLSLFNVMFELHCSLSPGERVGCFYCEEVLEECVCAHQTEQCIILTVLYFFQTQPLHCLKPMTELTFTITSHFCNFRRQQ